MITGLKKKQKTTEIYFNEADDITTISTYNTKLKNRLKQFAKECPNLCKLISDDELGCLAFEINKNSFTFRCTKPASAEKREKAREQMNKLIGKTIEASATISETETKQKGHFGSKNTAKNSKVNATDFQAGERVYVGNRLSPISQLPAEPTA